MKLTNIEPRESLKRLLIESGVTIPIYANNDIPTSELSKEFITIHQNGVLNSLTKDLSFTTSTLALGLSVKLLSNGATNVVKQKIILSSFEEFIDNKGYDNNYFEFDLRNLMSDTRSIISGYSTKIINIKVKTYKK